jgi:outer membrane lipoprotein-sorting protein
MRLTLISGKPESGQIQEYRSAPGYLLLQRPDSIRLNIQNPVTKTSIAELLSVGDAFSLWYPRENKFYMGSNSAKELALEGEGANPVITARPAHIFEAVLPQNLPRKPSGVRITLHEDQDATTKYYILSMVRVGDELRATPVRKLWIDRSDLTVVRQQTFDEQGRLLSLIRYGNPTAVDGIMLPLTIRIERPLDGYSIDLQFKDWRLNPQLPENAFVMNPPAGAKKVELKEKG